MDPLTVVRLSVCPPHPSRAVLCSTWFRGYLAFPVSCLANFLDLPLCSRFCIGYLFLLLCRTVTRLGLPPLHCRRCTRIVVTADRLSACLLPMRDRVLSVVVWVNDREHLSVYFSAAAALAISFELVVAFIAALQGILSCRSDSPSKFRGEGFQSSLGEICWRCPDSAVW